MIEDKLSYEQRLRLECLAQAVQRHAMRPVSDMEVIETARRYEAFLKEAGQHHCIDEWSEGNGFLYCAVCGRTLTDDEASMTEGKERQ